MLKWPQISWIIRNNDDQKTMMDLEIDWNGWSKSDPIIPNRLNLIMMDDFQSQFLSCPLSELALQSGSLANQNAWFTRSKLKNRKNPVYINNLLIIIGISRCECQIDFDGRHSKLYLTQKCQKDATRHGPNHTLCFRYTQSYIQCTFYPVWLV